MIFDEKINKWILNSNKKILFIYGDSGNGKTTYLKNFFKETYEIKILDYLDYLDGDFEEKIVENNKNRNVLSMLSNKKYILFIRDIEQIQPRKIYKILNNINDKNNLNTPIILIGSGTCEQHIKFFKKRCEILKYENDNNYIKDTEDIGKLYENIFTYMTEKLSYEKIKKMFLNNKTLFPLFIHENFIYFIRNNSQVIEKILGIIIETEKILNYIIKNNEWDLIEDYIYNNCYKIHCVIHENRNKIEKNIEDIKYSKVSISKTTKKLYRSYYRLICEKINIDTFDYEYIFHINRMIVLKKINNENYSDEIKKFYSQNKNFVNKIARYRLW
jgi:hypothetical protein